MDNLSSLKDVCGLWEHLQNTDKKIVLYGMGDGADKILNVCQEKNITVSGVFASDEFVRYQTFRGFTVKKYSELKSEFGDMIILVSFASSLPDVMERIYSLTEYDELYAPDVPVFGEGLFDKDFFFAHYDEFSKVYSLLSDEQSRKVFFNIIKYKLTGNIILLRECESYVSEAYKNIIIPKEKSVYVDIGAYNGDTLREYLSFAGNYVCAYCFEPDKKNFKKLAENSQQLQITDLKLFNVAAWDKKEELVFYSRSGRNSAHTTAHAGLKTISVDADRVDNYIEQKVDFINIDAEGSDINALEGLTETIEKYKPTISCALYHRNEDMFAIPLFLAEKYGTFKMYIRHFPYIPAWDTNVYIKAGE